MIRRPRPCLPALLRPGFASQERRHAARRANLGFSYFGFCDFPRGLRRWWRRGDSTAASAARFHDWLFDDVGHHCAGEFERAGRRECDRVERFFRKRAGRAFRHSGGSGEQSRESFFRKRGAAGSRDHRCVAQRRRRTVRNFSSSNERFSVPLRASFANHSNRGRAKFAPFGISAQRFGCRSGYAFGRAAAPANCF